MDDLNKSIVEFFTWCDERLQEGYTELLQEVDDITVEIDAALDVWFQPLWSWLEGVDEQVEQASRPFVQTVTPVLQDHPACAGCRNYHGEAYGGQFLVCAIHPFGVDEPNCPDWESVWNT